MIATLVTDGLWIKCGELVYDGKYACHMIDQSLIEPFQVAERSSSINSQRA